MCSLFTSFKPLSSKRMLSALLKHRNLHTMSEFIQKLNPLTGLNQWVVLNEDYDYHQEVARAAFADMLHDTERNNMYERALKVAIDHMHAQGKKANVLDIGTGTGLLSMMAVRHKADSVVACEAFKPMGACALEVIKLNNCHDKIKVIPKRSTDIIIGEDMEFKANILVTEVFDTELIGEGALGTFQHAHKCLLESDCIVVPHSGTIYAQIIESPLLASWNRLNNVFNNDGELEIKVPEAIKNCKGTANLHDVQLSQLSEHSFNSLVEPQAVFRFDFSGRTPFIYERSSVSIVKSLRNAIAHGVFMWWDLNMDIDNKIILSCAPHWAHPLKTGKAIPWRDHWMQAIYYFPKELKVSQGSEVSLISCHDEYSLWFNIKEGLKVTDADYKCPQCDCNLHNAYARTRIGQLNDAKRTKKFLRIIDDYVNKDIVVLVLSQGFYAGLVAAKRAKKVYFLETNQVSRYVTASFIKENGLENVEIVDASGVLLAEKANIVLAEPYYTTSIVPWDNLLLLHLLKKFQASLTDDVRIFPQKCIIKAVAMQFDDLHKIRAPLGTCNGFLMKPFDHLIESCEISDEVVEAQPLWEYPGLAVSETIEVASFSIHVPNKESNKDLKTTFEVKPGFKCNGIAVWVDWILDDERAEYSTVTSGPVVATEVGKTVQWDVHSRQGVSLLGNREMPSVFDYALRCDFESAECTIEFKPVS
ncbi:protein arginine N-methyltransferase 7 isoform X2 [Atheta coriaria]|uniref:protein arginine N-methyltransferase 7 isoform X2 n=1 Tax=Dalotia coriaria TaxID=877792 RepID=UPI0031F372F5